MQLKQYYLACLAHASYMIGDEESKTAVVVDPQRDIAGYLDDADRAGLTIRHVFLTHFHADFVAGHIELQKQTGASIHLGRRAEAEFSFEAMADGSTLEFGSVRLKIIETPGHTPEGISIVVFDLEVSDEQPKAVLTGDTLFIGDVGRPDLMASTGTTAEELAGDLYDSLRTKLLTLPDDTLVYPAHGAGSMCGKNLSTDTVSTMGIQKEVNYALQPMSKPEFIELVTADQPDAPDYFSYDAMLNKTNRETLDVALEGIRALNLAELQELIAKDRAQLVDTRRPADFAAAHMLGSLNIELEGKFATWAGTLLNPELPIVIIGDSGTEIEAGIRLGRIGFDRVAGYLDAGMRALRDAPELVGHVERTTTAALSTAMATPEPPLLVDVRTPGEYASGHIPGAINLPLNQLPERLHELPENKHIILTCRTSSRSSTAVSLIRAAGIQDVVDQRGGLVDWQESGKEIELRKTAIEG